MQVNAPIYDEEETRETENKVKNTHDSRPIDYFSLWSLEYVQKYHLFLHFKALKIWFRTFSIRAVLSDRLGIHR